MAMKCLHTFNYHVFNLPCRVFASPQVFLLPFGPKNIKISNNSCFLRHRYVDFVTNLCHNNTLRCSQSYDGFGFDCRDYYEEEICEHFDKSPVNCDQNIKSDVQIQFFQEATEIENNDDTYVGYYSYMSCWVSSKLELFGPSFFGMKPDPAPEFWPKDEGTKRSAEFALEVQRRRATSNVAIMPTLTRSLKMVKPKNHLSHATNNYWQVAGDFSYCSVRKVFSVTIFMIQELMSYMLRIRESLYSEDLRKVMDRVQIEINYTFVWLFESVFASTPTLMVSVMLLLANFTAHSMAGTVGSVAACIPRISSISTCYADEEEDCGGEETMISLQEKELWAKMLKQATNFELEYVNEATMGSQFGDRVRRSNYMLCQTIIDESLRYSLLLLNSALFLNPNPQVLNRAEECFKRAIMMNPEDAELRIMYADFLWLVKKDLTSAEQIYTEAVEVDPSNYHTFKYKTFLLETGSNDICFPLYDLGTNVR